MDEGGGWHKSGQIDDIYFISSTPSGILPLLTFVERVIRVPTPAKTSSQHHQHTLAPIPAIDEHQPGMLTGLTVRGKGTAVRP